MQGRWSRFSYIAERLPLGCRSFMRRSCGSNADVTTCVSCPSAVMCPAAVTYPAVVTCSASVTCPAVMTCRLCLRWPLGCSRLQTKIPEDISRDLGLCVKPPVAEQLAIESIPDSDFSLAISVSIGGHGGEYETEESSCHDAPCVTLLETGRSSDVSPLSRTRACI